MSETKRLGGPNSPGQRAAMERGEKELRAVLKNTEKRGAMRNTFLPCGDSPECEGCENNLSEDDFKDASHPTDDLAVRSRMKALIESLKKHRDDSTPDNYRAFAIGYVQALDTVIEILEMEMDEKSTSVRERSGCHHHRPARPEAPLKGPCEGCEEKSIHGDAACKGCFYRPSIDWFEGQEEPLAEEQPKPSIDELRNGPEDKPWINPSVVEEAQKALAEKQQKIDEEKCMEKDIETLEGNLESPISIGETEEHDLCDGCEEKEECELYNEDQIGEVTEGATVRVTNLNNLDEPIKIGIEKEREKERQIQERAEAAGSAFEEPPFEQTLRSIPGKLLEKHRRKFQELIDNELKGPTTSKSMLDSTLAEGAKITGIGFWTDVDPAPALALNTYRLAFRSHRSEGTKGNPLGIFPVLIDRDYNVWIGMDLRKKSVSIDALKEATFDGAWWSESMIIPTEYAELND